MVYFVPDLYLVAVAPSLLAVISNESTQTDQMGSVLNGRLVQEDVSGMEGMLSISKLASRILFLIRFFM